MSRGHRIVLRHKIRDKRERRKPKYLRANLPVNREVGHQVGKGMGPCKRMMFQSGSYVSKGGRPPSCWMNGRISIGLG